MLVRLTTWGFFKKVVNRERRRIHVLVKMDIFVQSRRACWMRFGIQKGQKNAAKTL